MNEPFLFLMSFIFYIIAAFFYFSFLFSKRETIARAGFKFVFVGLLLHTAALILRTVESAHAPFTNMYESLSFFAWASIFAYVIVEFKYKIRKAGPYFMLIVIA